MRVEHLSEERTQYQRALEAKDRLYGRFVPVVPPTPPKPFTYRKTNSYDAWALAMRGEARYVRLIQMAKSLADARRITVDDILKVVCTFYQTSKTNLLSRRRDRNIVRPRQVVMFLARELTRSSLPEIGRRMGGLDHTTVLHGVRAVRQRMDTEGSVAEEIADLMKILRGTL